MERVNDWAEKILSVFPDRSRAADLDRFITEVNNDQAEQMFFQKELDAASETRPTYEQLSLDRIVNEAQMNLGALKALESWINDRLQAYAAYHMNVSKARSLFESFENMQGTLRMAFDSMYLFTEQDITQSRQQIFLNDLRKSLSEIRSDAGKRLSDYQREVANAERDVVNAEKKLTKSRELADRSLNEVRKKKNDGFELDSLLFNAASRIPLVGSGNKDRGEKSKDSADETQSSSKGDSIKEDIRNLLRCISYRDQVLKASRRALQKLDVECKQALFYSLRKILDKEKEHLEMKKLVVDKFDLTIKGVNVQADINDFIGTHVGEGGELVYSGQALSLLTDLCQPPPIPPDSSLDSLNKQPAPPSRSSSPALTPQSSPPSASNHKHIPLLPTNTGQVHNSSPTPVPPPYEVANYLSHIFYTQQVDTHASPLDINRDSGVSTHSDSSVQSEQQQSTAPVPTPTPLSTQTPAATTNPPGVTNNVEPAKNSRSPKNERPEKPPPPPRRRDDPSILNLSLDEDTRKSTHRKARVSNMDIKFRDVQNHASQQMLHLEANETLKEATRWLCEAVKTLAGREVFITELNQYRSRKVNLGSSGFDALGIVLWTALSYCQLENDIRTAKVIMMLSQTFYRKIEHVVDSQSHSSRSMDSPDHSRRDRLDSEEMDEASDEEREKVGKRGTRYRQFIKESILGHSIWQDGNYWEQTLWQCALEQLQTIPYEKPWYEMDKDSRNESVRRVHDVLFSQVMAVIHSMMELGCSKQQCREFLYRMCVIHELSERQRQQLLSHVLRR